MNSEKLARFAKLSLEWNEKINITAIRDEKEFMVKNVNDSLSLCGRPEIENASRVLDMGTGGGLPGMPLAIAYPEKKFVLVDSVGKKLKVIDDVAAKLGVTNVTTIHCRAEDLASKPEYREGFDLVVSRAVANLSSLCEYCLPFVRVGGSFVAYKTKAAAEEIEAAANAIRVLGGAPFEIVESGAEEAGHIFVVIKKIKACPKQYPRKAGTPTKLPL